MEQLKDYLHLYGLGFEVIFDNKVWKIAELKKRTVRLQREDKYNRWNECHYNELIVPLRPLSDITSEEMLEYVRIERPEATEVKFYQGKIWSFYDPKDTSFYKWMIHSIEYKTAEQYKYLLKQGFDIFGLIESGLAIDKTKI